MFPSSFKLLQSVCRYVYCECALLELDCTMYRSPPVEICSEFEVEKTELPPDVDYSPAVRSCCYLLLVMAGECVITSTATGAVSVSVSQGHVYFVSAGMNLTVKAMSAGVVYYKAHVNMQNL